MPAVVSIIPLVPYFWAVNRWKLRSKNAAADDIGSFRFSVRSKHEQSVPGLAFGELSLGKRCLGKQCLGKQCLGKQCLEILSCGVSAIAPYTLVSM